MTGVQTCALPIYKLGNTSLYPDRTVKTAGATEITTTCPAFGNQTRGNYIDNTAPVNAFAGLANGDWSSSDTATAAAIGAGTMNYFYTRTEAANLTDSILVCVYKNVSGTVTANEYIGGGATTACSKRVAGTGTGTNIPITTATLQANQLTNTVIDAYTGSAGGQVVISVQSYDKAGNIGNKITRIVAYDATAPTASTATVASITQGSAPSVSSFLNDNLSVAQYNLEWTVASTAGQASNTTANLGTLTNAEIATASNAVFRQGATSTGDLITTSPYTKFLNVAATATAPAINYLVKWGAAAPGSNADNILALAGAATTFRVAAFDQTGARSTLEGFAAPTITDAMTLAGTGGSSLAGASGSLTNVALDGAFSYQTNYAASSSAPATRRIGRTRASAPRRSWSSSWRPTARPPRSGQPPPRPIPSSRPAWPRWWAAGSSPCRPAASAAPTWPASSSTRRRPAQIGRAHV
mgnify:CR=1 FL=1